MTKYVVVGMGAAGIAAAEAIRLKDPQGSIQIIHQEADGYYSRPALAYYLSKEVNLKSLFPYSKSNFAEKGIEQIYARAESIDPISKQISLDSKKAVPYDRLLLAPGAKAVQPDIPGVNLPGVVYLDSLSSTKQILRYARRGKKAVVIGGGITALELVEGLAARNVEVDFLLRGTRYWSRVLDSEESAIIINRLAAHGVKIHRNTSTAEILEKNGKAAGVLTTDGKIITSNLVGIAVGVKPRTYLAQKSGIKFSRGILVDEYLQTSEKNIFAAGDAAEIYDPGSKTWIVDSLWPIARQQGRCAGLNMAGITAPYLRRPALNVTRLAGLTTTIIGMVGNPDSEDECTIVRGESEAWQQMPDAVVCQHSFDVNRLRLMISDRHILGAVLIGDQSLSRLLENLIFEEANISTIYKDLLKGGTPMSDILLSFSNSRS